jgi:hypothetical protein
MRESERSIGGRPDPFAIGAAMSNELSHEAQRDREIADRLSLQIKDARNPAHRSSLS